VILLPREEIMLGKPSKKLKRSNWRRAERVPTPP